MLSDSLMGALAEGLEIAQALHRTGNLADAERAYREILTRFPDHPVALHFLGVIASQTGHPAEASELLERALVLAPNFAEGFSNLGYIRLVEGNVSEAERLLRRAMSLDPNMAGCRVKLAEALRMGNKFAEAAQHYRMIVDAGNGDETVRYGLAVCGLGMGDLAECERNVDELLDINPDCAQGLFLKGELLRDRNETVAAISPLMRALQLRPDDVLTATALARALSSSKQFDAALAVLRHIEDSHPDHVDVARALADVLVNLKRPAEAVVCAQRALAKDAGDADVHCILGLAYNQQWELEKAEHHGRRAVELEPDNGPHHSNLAIILRTRGKHQESLECFERALTLAPDSEATLFSMALELMTVGRFEQAWPLFDVGIRMALRLPNFLVDVPALKHRDEVAGKRVLVRREQGVGDEVYFASVLPDLIKEADHCLIECTAKLKPLFTRSFPTATVLAEADLMAMEPVPADRQTLIGSLPGRYRQTLAQFPNPHRFLVPDAARAAEFRQRLAALPGAVKVGVVWRSRSVGDVRAPHYLTLAHLAPVLAVPGIAAVSLQYDDDMANVRREVTAARDSHGVSMHMFDDLDTFDDIDGLTALIDACDVVIGPITAVMHLAGGLGKPALEWLAIHSEQNLGQSYCPFTPSVEAFVPGTVWDKDEIVRLLLQRFPAFLAKHTGYIVPA